MNIPLLQRLRLAAVLAVGAWAAACSAGDPPSAPPPPQATAPGAATPQSAPAAERRAITLPADDAPHSALTEWWYYNGHVTTAQDDAYSFHLVVFKRRGNEGPAARAAYVAHVGITDHQRRVFRYDQALLLPPPQPQTAGGFDLRAGSVTLRGSDGADEVAGNAGDYALKLALRAAKPPVIHGDAGIVGVSPEEQSYYYSRTRMTASGELTIAGVSVPVTGIAWMDHQWGEFSLQGAAGWDWFAVNLDDGSDLMVSVLRDAAGRVVTQYGTWVAPDGTSTALADDQVRVQATGAWTSPSTRTVYPMGWRVEVASVALAVDLSAVTPDQEMDTTATTGKVYWEGAVKARGTLAARPVAGLGYVELTGYKERTAP